MRFDPFGLERELLAAGIVRPAFTGCRSDTRSDQDGSDDVAQIIDWLPGHPTPAERAAAGPVVAAHDPSRRATDEATARARLATLAGKCEDGSATPADVREALGKIIRRHLA